MTPAEVAEYLARELTVILISNGADGYPHPMPMHFCVREGGAIAMTTFRKSQKVLNLRRDPRASLLIESGATYDALRSVLMYCDTTIIDDTEATAQCMIECRAHSNLARGTPTSAAEDTEFAQTAAQRAQKRLVLEFQPQRVISWDHAKLGGRY